MKTRIQNHIIQHDCPEVDLNQFPSEFLKVVQLTAQQRELFILGDEMKKSISDLYSPFQKILKYSPDALNHLFDQCLIKPVDTQVQGDTFFDFFLFEADPWAILKWTSSLLSLLQGKTNFLCILFLMLF